MRKQNKPRFNILTKPGDNESAGFFIFTLQNF